MNLDGPPFPFLKWSSQTQHLPKVMEESAEVKSAPSPSATRLAQDRVEFDATVRPALPRLYRFCLALSGRRDQADDLFQNTLIKAYLNASSFEGRSELSVWLCGIAWHEHLEVRRTEARRKGLFEHFIEVCSVALGFGPERADQTTPEAMVADGQNHDKLLQCLQTLPEEFRAVVILCDIEELGYDRAAEMLGIPKGTVKSRHARGRVRLREAYEKLVMAEPAGAARKEESTP